MTDLVERFRIPTTAPGWKKTHKKLKRFCRLNQIPVPLLSLAPEELGPELAKLQIIAVMLRISDTPQSHKIRLNWLLARLEYHVRQAIEVNSMSLEEILRQQKESGRFMRTAPKSKSFEVSK